MKSGENGDKNCTRAPTSWIDFTTSGTWWILQLSMTTTESGVCTIVRHELMRKQVGVNEAVNVSSSF